MKTLLVLPFVTSVASGYVLSTATPVVLQNIHNPADIQAIQLQAEQRARNNHKNHNNHALNSLLVAVEESPVPRKCSTPFDMAELYGPRCSGQLPSDFPAGHLLRIGPNSKVKDESYLDGDGMIHCVALRPGKVSTHSATYVNTEGRQREQLSGKKYKGTLGVAPRGLSLLGALIQNAFALSTVQGQKDTCNTAISEMDGRLLALMEQSKPTEFKVNADGSITTVQAGTYLNGAIPANNPITGGSLSAHGRTCPQTGERIHVSYNIPVPPYARVDIFEKDWQLKKTIPIPELDCSVMLHDCAITENYAIILDFPLTIRPKRILLQDKFPVEYEPDHGARIGLVPRHGDVDVGGDGSTTNTRWFSVDPCVTLHTVNAFETADNKVVLQALRSTPQADTNYITDYTAAFLYEWVLDLDDGSVKERVLNPQTLVEFPVIKESDNGKESDSVYCCAVSSIGGPLTAKNNPDQGMLMDGIVKFALKDTDALSKGDVASKFTLPKNWHSVSEPTVVGSVAALLEDMDSTPGEESTDLMVGLINPTDSTDSTESTKDYVLMIASQVLEGDDRPSRSQLLVLDGDRMDEGPLTAIELSGCVPYGLHSHFAKKKQNIGWE